jgi:hypothetical protein
MQRSPNSRTDADSVLRPGATLISGARGELVEDERNLIHNPLEHFDSLRELRALTDPRLRPPV